MKLNGNDIYFSFLKGKSFEHKGEYDATAVYQNTNQIIDCVLYNGTSYYCKKTTTAGIAPTNTEYWGIMASGSSGTGGGADLTNYYTKDETYSQEEVDELISGIEAGGTGGGSSIVVDSELSSTSENPVQNKVLYAPVTFAESERQKSKNLLYLYDFSFSYGGISFNNSESEQTLKITGTSTVANESQIGTIEPLALKAGHTYYFSWDIVSGTADINYIALYSSEIGKYTDLFVRNSQFTPTTDITYDRIRVWISGAGKTSDCVTKLQVTEDSSASEWQFPYGAIVHEKDITGVEFTETVYNMASSDSNINWGYTDGIKGGVTVTNKDFSKYKKLIITTAFNQQFNISELQLEKSSQIVILGDARGYMISPISASYDIPRDTHVATMYVNEAKTEFTLYQIGYVSNGSFNSRSTNNWIVTKIEGVYYGYSN